MPPALGIDHRVALRLGLHERQRGHRRRPRSAGGRSCSRKRAGYYFQHWDELYGRWQTKVEATIAELEALEVPELPDIEDEAVVTEGRGIGSSHTLLVAYNRLLESVDRIWQYHFEFLNLGYAAYLVFYELCKQSFPDIPDQAIAKMVAGIDVVLFRPDDELKRLAALRARARRRRRRQGAPTTRTSLVAALDAREGGAAWLADWEAVKTPWFNYSNGNGFYHHHRSWIDDPAIPLAALALLHRAPPGRRGHRPPARGGQRRARPHHRRVPRAARRRGARRRSTRTSASRAWCSRTSRATTSTSSTGTTRSSGTRSASSARCSRATASSTDAEDIFYLQRHEVSDALVDLRLAWAAGSAAAGPGYWPPIVARRKAIMEAMRALHAAARARPVPEAITEPMTIMLWGITTERVREWAADDRDDGRDAARLRRVARDGRGAARA